FSQARFIHLVRHPRHFIRSALARGYYQKARYDRGHILPVSAEERREWSGMTVLERIAWNWNATNAFIERFKQAIPSERAVTIRSEDLFSTPRVAEELIQFCGGNVPANRQT